MPVIGRRQPLGRRQTRDPVAAPVGSAAQGLVGWISMHGPTFRDHIAGAAFTPSGGAITSEATVMHGPWNVQALSTDGLLAAAWVSHFNPARGSWLMWVRKDDGSPSMTPLNIRFDGNNEIDINEFNGNFGQPFRFKYAGSGVGKEVFVPSLVVGAVTLLGMTWDTAADEMRCYFNGLQVGATVTGLPTMTPPTSCAIGNNTALNAGFRGGIGECLLYNRAISPAEMWSFYDPRSRWQLYSQPLRRLFDVPAAAAGGNGSIWWWERFGQVHQ
jgi:hypothetical protein